MRTEFAEVRLERDARPVLAGLARLDGRLALDGHVGAEDLAVTPLPPPVARLDHKLGREDVGQLGAVPVAAAGDLQSRENWMLKSNLQYHHDHARIFLPDEGYDMGILVSFGSSSLDVSFVSMLCVLG